MNTQWENLLSMAMDKKTIQQHAQKVRTFHKYFQTSWINVFKLKSWKKQSNILRNAFVEIMKYYCIGNVIVGPSENQDGCNSLQSTALNNYQQNLIPAIVMESYFKLLSMPQKYL